MREYGIANNNDEISRNSARYYTCNYRVEITRPINISFSVGSLAFLSRGTITMIPPRDPLATSHTTLLRSRNVAAHTCRLRSWMNNTSQKMRQREVTRNLRLFLNETQTIISDPRADNALSITNALPVGLIVTEDKGVSKKRCSRNGVSLTKAIRGDRIRCVVASWLLSSCRECSHCFHHAYLIER